MMGWVAASFAPSASLRAILRWTLGVLACLAMAGCESSGFVRSAPEPLATIAAEITTLEQARAFVADRTSRSHSQGHGNQIEYLSRAGTAHLWYPGNRSIVVGEWELRLVEAKQLGPVAICFRYGRNTYNPVTRQRGGAWECRPFAIWIFRNKEIVAGDAFGLGKNRLPFVMPQRTEVTLAEVSSTLGRTKPVGPNLVPERYGR